MSTTPKLVIFDPHGSLVALSRKEPEIQPLPIALDAEIQPSIRSRYPLETLLRDLKQALETSPELTETLANLEEYDSRMDLILPFRLEYFANLKATARLLVGSPDMTPTELFRALRARADESDREWVASMQERAPSQAHIDHDFSYRLSRQAFLTVLAQTLANPQTLTSKGGNHAQPSPQARS